MNQHAQSRWQRRPRLGAIFAWLALSVLLAGSGLLSLMAITAETGLLGLITGSLLAAVPVIPVVAAFLWLDRYESEPRSLLLFAFAWGAGVATLGALVINTASVAAIQASGGDPTAGAIFVAPVVEESLKGLAVLIIVLWRRSEFDGVVDGIVYAGMAGIGFAFVENVLYLGRTMADSGVSGTVFIFVLRCVVSPFAHPLFTAATGVGLGLAVRTRNPIIKIIAPLLGFAGAVTMHAGWNLTASSGLQGFVAVYVLVQLPIFGLFIAVGVLARRREGQLIGRNLTIYANTGWLSPAEVTMLASLRERRVARNWADRTGGRSARQAMHDFQELGSELAFLRAKITSGDPPQGAQTVEHDLLASMAALRGQFSAQL